MKRNTNSEKSPVDTAQPFHWTKIPSHAAKGTVWLEVNTSHDIELTELAQLFRLDDSIKKKDASKKPAADGTLPSVLNISKRLS